MSNIDTYLTEQYIDAVCRDTGVTREEAIDAMRRTLKVPAPDVQVHLLQVPRAHNPGAVLLVLSLAGAAWTSAAAVVGALICGWRP